MFDWHGLPFNTYILTTIRTTIRTSIDFSYITIMLNLTLVDCGDPMPPIDGHFMATNGTKERDYVTYYYDEGFIPSSVMIECHL